VLLGIQPPENFLYMYYRDNCADNEHNIDDIFATPIETITRSNSMRRHFVLAAPVRNSVLSVRMCSMQM